MTLRSWIAPLFLSSVLVACPLNRGECEEALVTVKTLDGSGLGGRTLSYVGGQLSVESATASPRRVELTDVVQVDFSASSRKIPPTPHEIALVTGDRIRGTILTGDETGLTITSAGLGTHFVSVDAIVQLRILANLDPGDRSEFPLKEDTDTAYRKTKKGQDLITGVLIEFDDKGATVDSPIGEYRIEFEDLLALSLLPQEEVEEPTELLTLVHGRDGSFLRGYLESLDDENLRLRSLLEETYTLSLDTVAHLSFKNGRFVYLSDLDPTEVRQVPFIGDPDDFLFPFRRDQSVGGNGLRIAGKNYRRGLGVHSHCELTYDLSGVFSEFRSVVGIDDEALSLKIPGAVEFSVLVDGQEKYRSPLVQAGTEGVSVGPIKLVGAKTLTLRVSFGDERHFGDRADWADAMLIRDPKR